MDDEQAARLPAGVDRETAESFETATHVIAHVVAAVPHGERAKWWSNYRRLVESVARKTGH